MGAMAMWFDPRRTEDWSAEWLRLWGSPPAATDPAPSWLLPVDPLRSLLDAAKELVVGRRLTVPVGEKKVSFVLDGVEVEASDLVRATGHYGQVVVRGRDVEWAEARIARLEVRARNVHLRPGRTPTLVAAPIRWEAQVAASQASAWLSSVAPHLRVAVDDEDGVRVSLAGAAPTVDLQVEPRALGRAVRLVPRSLGWSGRRIGLRLPGYTVDLRGLPPDVAVTAVEAGGDRVVVRGVVTEWQRSLSRADVDRLLTKLRSGRSAP
jgi:hypothetical protein